MAGNIPSVDAAMSSGLLRTASRRESDMGVGDALPPVRQEQSGHRADDGKSVSVVAANDEASSAEGLKKLQEMAEQLNQNPLIANQLMFEVRPEERLSIIKIVDVQTRETVRQIPSEEALARLEQIQRYLEQVKQRIKAEGAVSSVQSGAAKELLTGLLLNQQV